VKVCSTSHTTTDSARDRQHRRPAALLNEKNKTKRLFTWPQYSPHRRPDGHKEDCCSAASKNAESRQPASRYAERSDGCPAGALVLKQNGPFQGSSFRRPVMRRSSPPLLLTEASPLQKEFLRCSSATLSCARLKTINICYSARGCCREHRQPTLRSKLSPVQFAAVHTISSNIHKVTFAETSL
jgi:hypothetical protein